jgi:hypothetical protein
MEDPGGQGEDKTGMFGRRKEARFGQSLRGWFARVCGFGGARREGCLGGRAFVLSGE